MSFLWKYVDDMPHTLLKHFCEFIFPFTAHGSQNFQNLVSFPDHGSNVDDECENENDLDYQNFEDFFEDIFGFNG